MCTCYISELRPVPIHLRGVECVQVECHIGLVVSALRMTAAILENGIRAELSEVRKTHRKASFSCRLAGCRNDFILK